MILSRNKSWLKAWLGVVFIIVITLNVYSYVIANRGEDAFSSNSGKKSAVQAFIVDGAGYFLESYSHTLRLLGKIETSSLNGVNGIRYHEMLDLAITAMEKSVNMYDGLCRLAEATAYSPETRGKLQDFDYEGFAGSRQFNPAIFLRVKKLLKKGDVRGLFGVLYENSGRILTALKQVKAAVITGELPVLADLWRLNRLFSQTLMLGQQAAEVFYNLK